MSTMRFGLLVAGGFSLALGLLHLPRIWGAVFRQWNAELEAMSLLGRKLVTTVLVAFFLALIVLGMTTLSLAKGGEPLDGPFQLPFFAACCLFWIWRLVWQVLYFTPRVLNPARWMLVLHAGLIVIFAVNAASYSMPLLATLVR